MQSLWYEIARALGAQVRAVADGRGVSYLDNPVLPLDLQGAQRALFVLQRGDRVVDQPGQVREKRRVRVLVGAVSLTGTGLAAADELHFAARLALRANAFREALRAAGDVGPVREVEVEPELKDMAAPGSVLMSAFEIDYFQTYPAA